jgi:hypothetical protein
VVFNGMARGAGLSLFVSFLALGCAPTADGGAESVAQTTLATLPADWSEADIGGARAAPASETNDACSPKRITVWGYGRGLNDSEGDTAGESDQFHYIYRTIPNTADYELVVRLVEFSPSLNPTGAQAGLVLRSSDNGAVKSMGAVSFGLHSASNGNSKFFSVSRGVDSGGVINRYVFDETNTTVEPPSSSSGCDAPNAPPVWMRIRRLGNDYSVAYSLNGTKWSPVAVFSGGEARAPDTPRVGFFVSSNDSSQSAPLAKAVFEIDYAGAPRPDFATTWIGGTHSQASTGSSTAMTTGMYADPIGRVYRISHGGELGRTMDVYQGGQILRRKSLDFWGTRQGAVTGDPAHENSIFALVAQTHNNDTGACVRRFSWASQYELNLDSPIYCPSGFSVGGMAARNDNVYLTAIDSLQDGIRILNRSNLSETGSFNVNTPGAVHPGAIAADAFNRLWVIETSNAYTSSLGNFREPGSPAPVVRCYSTSGAVCTCTAPSSCSQDITGLSNPVALATNVDGTKLFVADNGPEQRVRVYTLTTASPPHEGTALGRNGGVYSTPRGEVYSASNGGFARFYNLTGVGVDGFENIYVSNGDRADIRSFGPGSSSYPHLWHVFGFADFPAFDPQVGAGGVLDLFTAREHFKLDPATHGPGSEWSFHGLTYDPFAYEERNEDGRIKRRSGATWVRRIGGARFLFHEGHPDTKSSASLQSTLSSGRRWIMIYRFDQNDMAVPAASLSMETYCDWDSFDNAVRVACGNDPNCWCNLDHETDANSLDKYPFATLWVDADGDGIRDEAPGNPCGGEVECTIDPFVLASTNSTLASQMESTPGQSTEEQNNPGPPTISPRNEVDSDGNIWMKFQSNLWRLRLHGINAAGAPVYHLGTLAGGTLGTDSSLGAKKNYSRLIMNQPAGYNIAKLRVDAATDTVHFLGSASSTPGQSVIGRYTDWFGARTLSMSSVLPNDYMYTDVGFVGAAEFYFSGFDVANDKYFVAEHFGPIRIHEASNGAELARLSAGAEVSGFQNWNDGGLLRAFYTGSDYIVLATDSAGLGRTLAFRWTPPNGCTLDSQCTGTNQFCNNGVCSTRPCSLSSAFGSMASVLPGSTSNDGFSVSPDGLTAFFSRKQSSDYDIYTATRASTSAPFNTLSLVSSVNSSADDRAPFLSADQLRLYFWTKNTSNGNSDLVVATRSSVSSAFGAPQAVPGVNSSVSDQDPYFLEGEQTLFFASDRPTGERHLHVTTKTNGSFSTPTQLAVVNSYSEDTRPVPSRDGLTLFFKSQRSGLNGDTEGDIWLSQRSSTGTDFGTPVNLSALNSSGIDFPVSLSADGCSLYMASNREHGKGSTQVFELYEAKRQAVPAQITVTLNVTGNGSDRVLTPYDCAIGNSGTCSVQQPFGTALTVNATRKATWSGVCGPNDSDPLSTDGIIPYDLGGTCNVTFP